MSRLLEQMRNAVEQQESMLREEQPDDMPAGTKGELAFFGSISALLAGLVKGMIDIAEWNRRVRALEEDATNAGRLPLASRTFLNLAKRHVRREANIGNDDSQRLPDFSEAKACARVLLAYDTAKHRWERDLHPEELSQHVAEQWLSRRGLDDLLSIIGGSEQSTICWDALELICGALAGESVHGRRGEFARYKTEPPLPLYAWRFEAFEGLRRRPPESAPPPHRRAKLGYMIRDMRIRGTIWTLAQVGVPPTDGPDSGCNVVTDVLGFKDSKTVREIWKRPDMRMNESRKEYIDRLLV